METIKTKTIIILIPKGFWGYHVNKYVLKRIKIVALCQKFETAIIVHIEPQSSYPSHFNQGMFQYYSLLYNKLRKLILPIAVFSYDKIGIRKTNLRWLFQILLKT